MADKPTVLVCIVCLSSDVLSADYRPPLPLSVCLCVVKRTRHGQVTGATGFVGSHILVQLHEAGYPIRACVSRVLPSRLPIYCTGFGIAKLTTFCTQRGARREG